MANPPGTPEDRYRHIDAAIAIVQRSGLKYEVEPLGTTVEGTPDELWPLLREVHEACLASGPNSVVTVIKVAQASEQWGQLTMEQLTQAFR